MDFRFYFNSNFVANNTTYFKFMMDIPGIGCFGSIYNTKTHRFEDQKRIYKNGGCFDIRLIRKGIKDNMFYVAFSENDDIETVLKTCFKNAENHEYFYVFILHGHFRSAFSKFNDFVYYKHPDSGTINFNKLREIRSNFINTSKYFHNSPEAFNKEIVNEQTKTSIADFIRSETKARNIIKQVKLLNADGFSNLVKGNFYDFTENTKNSNYIVINGINVHKNRVKFVNIYSEPPVSNADAMKQINPVS